MNNSVAIEERGNAAVAWQKGPRHKFYEDRYRLLCHPIPLVAKAARGEIFAVCDGVGSADKGMAAAQEVCSTLISFYENAAELLPSSDTIGSLLTQANKTIHSWGLIDDSDRPLGACAGTVVWITEELTAHVFHAGDTSALLIRDGTAQPLTSIQHSVDGHLMKYFGQHDLELETRSVRVYEGDRLLLMSDGITKSLFNQQIVQIIEAQPTRPASLRELFKMVRLAGSGDDATAVLIDIDEH